MRTHIKALFHLPLLITGIGLVLAGKAGGQTFRTLYNFTATGTNAVGDFTNREGAYPSTGLISLGTTLYGITQLGGSSGKGTIFSINADGTGFSVLHSFRAAASNIDGLTPNSLILSGDTLYGTALRGGSGYDGTVFALKTDGTGFRTIHGFSDNEGAEPIALVLSNKILYGTTRYGGYGSVFAINTDGTGFTNLYSFKGSTDGAYPSAGLILSGGILYGTTPLGGISGNGTIFAIHTDGTGITLLYSFTATSPEGLNADGAHPDAGLTILGNTLYGTTMVGGSSGQGTAFKVNTDGTGFTILHSFSFSSSGKPLAEPFAGLILSGGTVYGRAQLGGSSGNGEIFAVDTDGAHFTTLHSFANGLYTNSEGIHPNGGLILSGNTLYGTTLYGGTSGNGTVFSISFSPRLSVAPSRANVVLWWPTNCAGFDFSGYILQSTTNPTSLVWTTNLPAPIVVNGQNTVTNPISATKQFFRLSK